MDRLPKMLVPVVMVAMLVMRASANDVPPAAVAARAAVVETPEAPVAEANPLRRRRGAG